MIIQKEMISVLTGDPEYADAWARLLTSRDFLTPCGQSLRYAVGQPLGAYSSWGAFTLAHHFVVWLAQTRCAKADEQMGYLILGDDIVIRGADVAMAYKEIMTSIGVEISESKSHVSNDSFEFAKRWFIDNEEVTPFPMRGLIETKEEYHLLMATLVQAKERAWHSTLPTDHPELLMSLILALDITSIGSDHVDYLVNKCRRFLQMPITSDSRMEVAEKAKTFLLLAGADRNGQSACHNRYKSAYEIFIEATDRVCAQIMMDGISTLQAAAGKTDAMVRTIGSGAHLRVADVREFHPLYLSLARLLSEREKTVNTLFSRGIHKVGESSYQTKSLDFQPMVPTKSLIRYPLVAIPDPFKITSERVSARIQGTRAHVVNRVFERFNARFKITP